MVLSKIRLIMAGAIVVGGVVIAHRVHVSREAEAARKRRLEKEAAEARKKVA